MNTLFVRVSLGLEVKIREMVGERMHVERIEDTFPIKAITEPCLLLWENPPMAPDDPLGGFLRFLVSLKHVKVVAGDADILEDVVRGRFATPAPPPPPPPPTPVAPVASAPPVAPAPVVPAAPAPPVASIPAPAPVVPPPVALASPEPDDDDDDLFMEKVMRELEEKKGSAAPADALPPSYASSAATPDQQTETMSFGTAPQAVDPTVERMLNEEPVAPTPAPAPPVAPTPPVAPPTPAPTPAPTPPVASPTPEPPTPEPPAEQMVQEEDTRPVFLLAPQGDHTHFAQAMEQRGMAFIHASIPGQDAHIDKWLSLHGQMHRARFVFVWIPTEKGSAVDASLYEHVGTLLHKEMNKEIFFCRDENWQEAFEAQYAGELPHKQALELPKSGLPQGIEIDIVDYVEKVNDHAFRASQRDELGRQLKAEEPFELLVRNQRLWEQTSMNFRKTVSEFKPWVPKPFPKTITIKDGQQMWDTVTSIGQQLSRSAQDLLEIRESILDKITKTSVVQAEVKSWPELNEQAQRYFAWLMFRKGLRAVHEILLAQEKERREELGGEMQEMKTGVFASKREKTVAAIEENLRALIEQGQKGHLSRRAMELDSMEKNVIEEFWVFYTTVAKNWSAKAQKPEFSRDRERLFLRTGYINGAFTIRKGVLKEKLDLLFKENKHEHSFADKEVRVFYFDEFIESLAQGRVGPTYDENMELNCRGTTEWRQSRDMCREATGRRIKHVFEWHRKNLANKKRSMEMVIKGMEGELEGLKFGQQAVAQKIRESLEGQRLRLKRIARFLRMLEDKAANEEKEYQEALKRDKHEFPLDHWVEKEVTQLRSRTRLVNHLRERHLPDELLNGLHDAGLAPTTSELVNNTLHGILEQDVGIFDYIIVPHKHRVKSLIASCPPVVIIGPGVGQAGVCLEPAQESFTEGRFYMPSFLRNPKGFQAMMIDCCSDYRWDVAMIKAGADWTRSDTIVAAYSQSRWEFRHKGKEVREKFLIFKDESDKRNWRRHYRLFALSGKDAGKLLFFKSKRLYEAVIPYLPLPAGVKRLKSN